MYTQEENITAREYILQAFLELLGTKEFESIFVKEIVRKAGISRSTFYIHFQDKYELMNYLREDITSRFLAFYDRDREADFLSIKTTTLHICHHIFQYRYFYQHEFNLPEYTRKLSDALAEKLGKVYEDRGYAIFASFGTIGYLTYWVKGNFSMDLEKAAEDLAKIGVTDWSR
ncbi:TetR family transcriptional regulator [Oceanobacillus halophilus]|nr:TetR family transcriptional regulator [Oceanobacillus halophilus]